jgi:glycosyltransferase involved in cell wall biosynthesis
MIDVEWRGVFDYSGYGLWGRKCCYALLNSGKYRVKPVPVQQAIKRDDPLYMMQKLDASTDPPFKNPIRVLNLIPLIAPSGTRTGFCTCTELRTPPDEQIINLRSAKFIIALSSFSTRAFKSVVDNKDKVFTVNYPIFKGECSPTGKRVIWGDPVNKYKFKFLTVARIDVRKNLESLVKAFNEEFGRSKEVCLLVKIGSDAHCVPKWLSDLKPAPNIFWIEDFVENMADLYRGVDAYVCNDLGEAWSGPTHEAMLCGLPTIAPNHSGHLDYMTVDNSYLVDVSDWMPIGYREVNLYSRLLPPQGMVKYPDFEHLKETMRECYNEFNGLTREQVIEHKMIKEALKTQVLVDEPTILRQLDTAFQWISKKV